MKYIYLMFYFCSSFVCASDFEECSDEDSFLQESDAEEDEIFEDLIRTFKKVKSYLILRGPFVMKGLKLGDGNYWYHNSDYSLKLVFNCLASSDAIKDYFSATLTVCPKNYDKFSYIIDDITSNCMKLTSEECCIANQFGDHFFLLKFDDQVRPESPEIINLFSYGLIVEVDFVDATIKKIYGAHSLLRGKEFTPQQISKFKLK